VDSASTGPPQTDEPTVALPEDFPRPPEAEQLLELADPTPGEPSVVAVWVSQRPIEDLYAFFVRGKFDRWSFADAFVELESVGLTVTDGNDLYSAGTLALGAGANGTTTVTLLLGPEPDIEFEPPLEPPRPPFARATSLPASLPTELVFPDASVVDAAAIAEADLTVVWLHAGRPVEEVIQFYRRQIESIAGATPSITEEGHLTLLRWVGDGLSVTVLVLDGSPVTVRAVVRR
jgi:hypothetical protein